MYFGHPALCTNYVALCAIHMVQCVKRGRSFLSLIGSVLPTLFALIGVCRTRACESHFSFLARSSGSPTSALYRARNLVLLACHRGPDPGLCLSQSNTLFCFCSSVRLAGIDPAEPRYVPFLKLTPGAVILTFLRTSVSSHDKDIGSTLGMRRGCVC